MNIITKIPAGAWLIAFISGLSVGYLSFDNSAENRRISLELSQAKAAIARLGDEIARPVTGTLDLYEAPITLEDREVSLRLNKRERDGEYILKFERPLERKVMERAILGTAAKLASGGDPDLRATLLNLGATPRAAQLLQEHRDKICLASLETEMAMQQLLLARDAYDTRARAVLSAKQYERYRCYEDSMGAALQYLLIEKFAQKGGTNLDPRYRPPIMQAIQKLHAYAHLSWHGPYDGLPQIAVAPETILLMARQQITELCDESGKLHASLSAACLPRNELDIIDAYYSNEVTKNRELVERVKPSGPGAP